MAIYTSGIICEQALDESGVLSAIRIIDHVLVDLPSPLPAGTVVAYPVRIYAILSFKSDEPEAFDMRFEALRPDGNRYRQDPLPIRTAGGAGGHIVRIKLDIDPRLIGLWWFEVLIRDEVALRLPFVVGVSGPETPPSERPARPL